MLEQEEAQTRAERTAFRKSVFGRVRCYRDFKGMRVWPQKVAVTCGMTSG